MFKKKEKISFVYNDEYKKEYQKFYAKNIDTYKYKKYPELIDTLVWMAGGEICDVIISLYDYTIMAKDKEIPTFETNEFAPMSDMYKTFLENKMNLISISFFEDVVCAEDKAMAIMDCHEAMYGSKPDLTDFIRKYFDHFGISFIDLFRASYPKLLKNGKIPKEFRPFFEKEIDIITKLSAVSYMEYKYMVAKFRNYNGFKHADRNTAEYKTKLQMSAYSKCLEWDEVCRLSRSCGIDPYHSGVMELFDTFGKDFPGVKEYIRMGKLPEFPIVDMQ